MSASSIVGIDPGLSGGIVQLAVDGTSSTVDVSVYKMPTTERDLWDLLEVFRKTSDRVVIENVHSSPQMGVTSAFTFGRGVGGLHMALVGLRYRVDSVTPQKWRRALQCAPATPAQLGKKDTTLTRARAQELFPHIRITNWNTDALLIAEYGRRFIP